MRDKCLWIHACLPSRNRPDRYRHSAPQLGENMSYQRRVDTMYGGTVSMKIFIETVVSCF